MKTPTSCKPHAPSCDRNRDPILGVLRRCFADRRMVLEIGSGTGQHAVYFAAALPHLTWQTSDLIDNHDAIDAWIGDAGLPNVLPPLSLDVTGVWPNDVCYDAVFTANSLHIMSWSAVQALFAALPGVMSDDAVLAVYGPFNYGGDFSSASNRDFETYLKSRDARSGIRDFEAVNALAADAGLHLLQDCTMPANNRCLIWQRRPA